MRKLFRVHLLRRLEFVGKIDTDTSQGTITGPVGVQSGLEYVVGAPNHESAMDQAEHAFRGWEVVEVNDE